MRGVRSHEGVVRRESHLNSELFNLWLFFAVMGKVLLLTGIGPAIALAMLAEFMHARWRIVEVGVEQVSVDGRRPVVEGLDADRIESWAAGSVAEFVEARMKERLYHRGTETQRKAREGCAGSATAQYSARTRGSSFPSFEFLRASVPLWWKRSLRRHA